MLRRSVAGSASFYFGHTGTVLPLYAGLGLFRDARPLAAESGGVQSLSAVNDRQFRTSRIDPMSSNVAIVLYDCGRCTAASAQRLSRIFFNPLMHGFSFQGKTWVVSSVAKGPLATEMRQFFI